MVPDGSVTRTIQLIRSGDPAERDMAARLELRQIALWRLEGYTNREIADRLDCTERSIERRMERIRSRWISYDGGSLKGE
jgi:DNA-binding NarL/FixJ family response regulator